MENLIHDLRYGARMLLRNPGVTVVALVAMMLGIGANTTTFSTMDATLFHPFAFPTQERLVMLWESNPELGFARGSVSPANFNDWREQNQTLEQVVLMNPRYYDLTERDEPERFFGYAVSSSFFDSLGANALYGRTFASDEEEPGKRQVVVLKHNLWQRRFGADPNVINQTIRLNGKSFTVIGVMPPEFNFPFNGGEMWAPIDFEPKDLTNRGSHYLQVMGLLKADATIEQAREDLNSIAARAAEQFPETNAGRGVNVVSMTEDATRGVRMYASVMLAAVGFVLLIACANVANLLLVRGASRQKEIAIRMAMGASRLRIVRQLLTESVLLSLAGGALGLIVSVWGVEGLSRAIPEDFSKFIPGWHNLAINRTAFFFTLIVSVVTGVLFGLVPALQATKTNFNEALKEGGKGSSGKASQNRARSVLVVAEVALSLVLLISAGLMVRSFVEMMRSDFGVDPTNILTMQISLPGEKYAKVETRVSFFDQILKRVEALPGVTGVGTIGNLPMGGSNNSHGFERIGQTVYPRGKQPNVNYAPISPGYLEAIGTRLIKGRNLTEQDRGDSARVALVDEAFVREFLFGQEPIGQTFSEPSGKPTEIVGVTADVMNDDFDVKREPHIYIPYSNEVWRSMYLVIRAGSAPSPLTAAVRGEVSALDKTAPVFNVKSMDQVISERMSPKRLATVMMIIFALLALALAGVGIYAVMSYAVSQRTHEIGIRMALGAQARDIVKLVVTQGLILTLSGLAIGLAAAFAITRALAQLLYGVSATDLLTFLGISLLLGIVAMVACYMPTRKAIQVDPM
ncbi:MAG TPA: ABC transporter permease, partial [Blastocatellia bacterium]|nr:ABC transporter permease [Blastocatellia bacterium]